MSCKATYTTFRPSHIYKKTKTFCVGNIWPYIGLLTLTRRAIGLIITRFLIYFTHRVKLPVSGHFFTIRLTMRQFRWKSSNKRLIWSLYSQWICTSILHNKPCDLFSIQLVSKLAKSTLFWPLLIYSGQL